MNRHILSQIPSSLLVLLSSNIVSSVHAMPYIGAALTASYTNDGWSPRPTDFSAYTVDLFEQDSIPVSICGWVDGDLARPTICGADSSCIHDTVHSVVACCSTAGPCTSGIYTSCIDSTQGDPGVALQNGVLSCPGTSVCNRNTYPSGYYQYECGESRTDRFIATTFAGQPSSLQLNVISTAVVLSQAIVSTADLGTASLSAQATDSLSSTLTSSSMVSTTTATSQVSRPSETASQTSVSSTTISPSSADATAIVPASVRNNRTRDSRLAPIVGGTLGGVLILGSVLVSLFFCRRRNQKREAEKFHTGAFITQRGSDGEPFQQHEHAPFSPDDYGHRSLESVNTETPMTQQYAQTLSQHPPHPAVFPIVYRNARRDTQTPPPPEYAPPRANAHESTPLVSGMDESSHSWPQHAQPSIPRKPHPSDDVPPAMAEEPVQTWDVVNLRGGSGDRDHSRPPSPLRHISLSRIVRSPTADIAVREDGWRPEPLSPVSALTPPPKNPRRLELAASRSQSELKRYQLVDRPPRGDHVPVLHRRGDNVPILQSPGALRRQRRL